MKLSHLSQSQIYAWLGIFSILYMIPNLFKTDNTVKQGTLFTIVLCVLSYMTMLHQENNDNKPQLRTLLMLGNYIAACSYAYCSMHMEQKGLNKNDMTLQFQLINVSYGLICGALFISVGPN